MPARVSDIGNIGDIVGMAKFIFEMPDGLAASVEAYRVDHGHKATAVAVRALIATGLLGEAPPPLPAQAAAPPLRKKAPKPISAPISQADQREALRGVHLGPVARAPGSMLKGKK